MEYIKIANKISRKEEREALLQVERDFDRATAEYGAEGWASFFAEEGMMFPAGRDIVAGKDAILDLMGTAFSDPQYSLRWEPDGVQVAASGDLGYTFGHYVFTGTDQEGHLIGGTGKYVSIWKKQGDGTWKVVVDIGTPNRLTSSPSNS